MEFKDFVAQALANDPKLPRKLAKEFEIAQTTPERWAKGIARPHPLVRTLIVEFILREQGK